MTLRSVALLAFVAACSEATPDENTGTSSQAMFFENSQRRDATDVEAKRVAHTVVENGVANCTSFFVENSAGKVYVASARHCFGNSIGDWCARGGSIKDNAGVTGKCKRVVAADFDHDIAVVEVDIEHASTGPSTLRLAAYAPAVNDRLVMVGYPEDADPQTARKGKLTTTENCWVLSPVKRSPYETNTGAVRDMSIAHNCSTYGGNSGGPMYLEGTRHVVGLPFTYVANDYTRRSPTKLETAASMALVGDYVFVHGAKLREAGISIAQAGESDAVEGPAGDAGSEAPAMTPPTTRSATLPEPPKRLGTSTEDPEGGCSTTRAAPTSGTLLVIAMLLLVRTRRAPGSTSSRRS